MFPKITVDNVTCLGPLDCGLCLRECPMTVFAAAPTKLLECRETDRKDYQVYARYYDQCITCNKCVEVCPVNAITVATDRNVAAAPTEDKEEAVAPTGLSTEQTAPAD
jgi:formate hydrogenlyase subunit 6/NADH:ubiquinone oxidoreductase subunit I